MSVSIRDIIKNINPEQENEIHNLVQFCIDEWVTDESISQGLTLKAGGFVFIIKYDEIENPQEVNIRIKVDQ